MPLIKPGLDVDKVIANGKKISDELPKIMPEPGEDHILVAILECPRHIVAQAIDNSVIYNEIRKTRWNSMTLYKLSRNKLFLCEGTRKKHKQSFRSSLR